MNVFSWVNWFITCALFVPRSLAAMNLKTGDTEIRRAGQDNWFRKKTVVRRKEDGASITSSPALASKLQYATPLLHSVFADNILLVK
jgi:hypothetical protein